MNKVTAWAIIATVTRDDGTWFDRTITEVDDDTATLSRDTSQTSDASLVTHAEILLPDGRPKGVRVKSKGGNKKKNKVKNKSDEVAPSEGGTRGGGDKKGKKANRRELEQRQARREKAENLKKRYEKEQENLARERGQIVDDVGDSVESVRFYDEKTEKLKQEYSSKGLNLVFVDPFSVDTPPPVPASAPNVHIVTLTPPTMSTSSAPLSNSNVATSTENLGQKCNTCGGSFPDASAYRAHFKSEWHRHNLKLKMKGEPIIPSEELFLELAPEEVVVDEMVGH